MTTHADVSPSGTVDRTSEVSSLYGEGIVAGMCGAAAVALWFLIVDTISGRPLYTPSLLGTALFRHGEGLGSPEALAISFDMVLVFTWIHLLVFCVIGGVASHLIALAERRPNVGFGIILLFVIFDFGFIAVAMGFAQPVLHALGWPQIMVGNLLAAAAMGVYFWRRHPHLRIEP